MSNNNSQIDYNSKRKAKKIFFILLSFSILMVIAMTVGIVFTFIYIKYLELYQSLIVGGAMALLVACAVATAIWFNKAFKD